jgi:translation elongation factor EF-Tu-like GTPase
MSATPAKTVTSSTRALLTLALAWFLSVATMATHAQDAILSYPADANTPASLTLLPRQGKIGRDNPFYDGYRPEFHFSGEKVGITCTVHLIQPKEKVEPGETADVAIRCPQSFRVRANSKAFVAYEGGRKVAEGTLP